MQRKKIQWLKNQKLTSFYSHFQQGTCLFSEICSDPFYPESCVFWKKITTFRKNMFVRKITTFWKVTTFQKSNNFSECYRYLQIYKKWLFICTLQMTFHFLSKVVPSLLIFSLFFSHSHLLKFNNPPHEWGRLLLKHMHEKSCVSCR